MGMIQHFIGHGGVFVNLTDRTIASGGSGQDNGLVLASNGELFSRVFGFTNGTPFSAEWISPAAQLGIGSQYEALWTISSGTIFGGAAATGVWHPLSTNRLFSLATTTGVFTVQIRNASTLVVEDTATYTVVI
jgi:hypothetical protein